MYKLELFTRVRSPYIWQTRKRANAPDSVNRQLSNKWKGLGIDCREYIRDILIFTSSALKHGYYMLIYFIHGYYCIYRPWQPLTYLYFPYCISIIYFSFTKIRMFLYAQIYWLAEFGDVSCLQFNYLRVETLTPTWEDFVGQF
jgi:hypothetical protein